jgi:hypothetical protein
VDKITEIWESGVSGDISVALTRILELILEAKKKNEEIPLDLELEIVINANFVMGYGTTFEQVSHLLNLLNKILESDARDDRFHHRFLAMVCSSILTMMTVDESSQIRDTHRLMNLFGITSTSTRSDILRKIYEIVGSDLEKNRIDLWFFEAISFVLIYAAMLQEMGTWVDSDEIILDQIKSKLIDINEDEMTELEKWRTEWMDKNDYFRFTYLMLTNKNANEQIWLRLAEDLIKMA